MPQVYHSVTPKNHTFSPNLSLAPSEAITVAVRMKVKYETITGLLSPVIGADGECVTTTVAGAVKSQYQLYIDVAAKQAIPLVQVV
jgi:hypothetical protein